MKKTSGQPPHTIRSRGADDPPLARLRSITTERSLASAWFGGRLRHDGLRTTAGQSVDVLYPGRPGHAGPDAVGAVVAIGPMLGRGDVEFHVTASDWFRHGHGADRRYNDVVLHVVLAADAEAARENGTLIPTAVLDQRRFRQDDDSAIQPRCGVRLSGEVGKVLDTLGDERFAAHTRTIAAALARSGPDQALYTSLLDALGYAVNRLPCQRLAVALPWSEMTAALAAIPPSKRSITAEALLLGVAGLLQPPAPPGASGAHVAQLTPIWLAQGRQPALDRSCWRLAAIRPANAPSRRLAGLAALVAESHSTSLVGWLTAAVAGKAPSRWPALLAHLFTVPTPAASRSQAPVTHGSAPALIGHGRAAIIAVNVALPFLATVQPDAAWEAYRCFPRLPENEVTRHAILQIFGSPRPDVVTTARRQQGLQQLLSQYCSAGRCRACQA